MKEGETRRCKARRDEGGRDETPQGEARRRRARRDDAGRGAMKESETKRHKASRDEGGQAATTQGEPERQEARRDHPGRGAMKEGETKRHKASRDEGGRARTAGGETQRRRVSQAGRERDVEPLRHTTAPRLRPDRRRREGSAASKPPCRPTTGIEAPDAFSSSGEPAHLTTSSHVMLARRRIRRRTGVSARVLVREACDAAHPRLNGLGVRQWARRRRSGSPRAKRLIQRRAGARLLGRTASAGRNAVPGRAPGVRRGRVISRKDARARERMRALAKGCARSRKDARAQCRGSATRRRACRLALGRVRSTSAERARQRTSQCTKSAERTQHRASKFAVGRAGAPSGVPARFPACPLRIGRGGLAAGLGCTRVANGARAWANELDFVRPGSILRDRARSKMNGLKTGCNDSGIERDLPRARSRGG
jgi:hypothetical protein